MTRGRLRNITPALLALGALALPAGAALNAQAKSAVDPYWMSLRDDEANMRTGPRATYPIKWVYKRKHMPLKVVGEDSVWRKVEDIDGDQGWIHVKLLSRERTAVVTGEDAAAMMDARSASAHVNWRAEPGVVGKITECSANFCLFDVAGRMGYIDRAAIWGDEPLKGEEAEED
mgnify:CR=1 FL=1